MKHLFILLLIAGCKNPSFEKVQTQSNSSALASSGSASILKKLPKSQQIYVTRLADFVSELQADMDSVNHLVAIKNLLLDQPESYETSHSLELKTLADNQQEIDLLIAIKNELYRPDGALLKKLLLEAAKDPEKQEILLNGQIIAECLKQYQDSKHSWFAKIKCGLAHPMATQNVLSSDYGKLLLEFSETSLKAHLDQLEHMTGRDSQIEPSEVTWLSLNLVSILNYRSLGWLHKYVQDMNATQLKEWLLFLSRFIDNPSGNNFEENLSKIQPKLHAITHEILKTYTGKSLKDLNAEDLVNLLNSLSNFLKADPR